jgi:hypothetical protein
MELVRVDRATAQAHLTEKGLSTVQQESVLSATHCTPPESYLVVASEQLLKPNSWLHLGLWDFRRAYIVKRSRFLPQTDAVADLSARFGYSTDEATSLYTQVQTLNSDEQERNFIAPLRASLPLEWIACQSQTETSRMECPVGATLNQAGDVLHSFSYSPEAPGESLFHLRRPAAADPEGRGAKATPGIVLWADDYSLRRIAPPTSTFPHLGVLVDVPNQRVLLGSTPFVQSMLVQLLYLGDQYTEHFEKFDERGTSRGTRVVTWKICWEGCKPASSSPQ